MHALIQIASAEVGVHEVAGPEHNPRILQFAREAGFESVKEDEVPWCSIFMNWVAMKAGMERTHSASARSWLNAGVPVEHPEPGDVVVFWRQKIDSWQGHVGLFMGYSDDHIRIYSLGGNQGNQVSITAYPASQVLGFRRLVREGKYTLSNKVLKKGDTGPDVVQLQDALKAASYNPGTSDGIYGPRTEAAVRMLQGTSHKTSITGEFDSPTRELLLSVLNKS